MKHAHIFKSQRNFYILMQMNTSSFIPDESFLKDIDMVLYKYHLKKIYQICAALLALEICLIILLIMINLYSVNILIKRYIQI